MTLLMLVVAAGSGLATATPAGAAAATKSPIVIPYIATISGSAAAPGVPVEVPPAQMAIAAINKAGGIDGHMLEYKLIDDANDTPQAVSDFQSIENSALVIMGPIFGNPFSAVAPLANAAGIPLISGGSTVVAVAETNRPYIFMTNPNLAPIANQVAKTFLHANPTVRKVVLISDETNLAPIAQGQDTANALAAAGADVVGTVGYPYGTTDFSSIVTKAASMSPDAIIVSGQPADAAAIVQEIRRQGIKAVILGDPTDYTPSFTGAVGSAGVGMYVYTPFWPGASTPSVQAFNRAYAKASGGLTTNFTAAFVYESFEVVAAALRKANFEGKSLVNARKSILKALETVSITGVSGETVHFNSHGYVDRSGYLLRLGANGKTTLVTS